MNKEFMITFEGKEYRIKVSADDWAPIIRVKVLYRNPEKSLLFRWLEVGNRSEWLEENQSIEALIETMIADIFARDKADKIQRSRLEKYFSE